MEVPRSQPLHALLIGSGRQARRILRAARDVEGLSIDAIASPHAKDFGEDDFGPLPRYATAAEAIDRARPDAAIVAASTTAHELLMELCIERGIAFLIEKPVTGSSATATRLAEQTTRRGVVAMPVHQLPFSNGLDRFFAGQPRGRVSCVRRVKEGGADLPRVWSRAPLFESLYHLVSLIHAVAGPGPERVQCLQARGAAHPTRLAFDLAYAACSVELVIEVAETDDLELRAPGMTFRRCGSVTSVEVDGVPTPFERRGSDLANLLEEFRRAVASGSAPRVGLLDAVSVMEATTRILDAIEGTGTVMNGPQSLESLER